MLASQDNVQLFKLLCQPHHIIIMWKHKYWALEGGRVSREHQRREKADLLRAQPCSRSCSVFPSRGFALEMLLEEPTSYIAQPARPVGIHSPPWLLVPIHLCPTSICPSQILGGVTSGGKHEEDVQAGKKSHVHTATQNCLSRQQHVAGEPGKLPSEFHSSGARAASILPERDWKDD